MPRYAAVWAAVAVFTIALIIYYIYFLDLNGCIVEKDSSGEEYYTSKSQSHNTHTNYTKTSPKQGNFTLPECPPVNLTSLCSNFTNNVTYVYIINNSTNNIKDGIEKVNNTNTITNNTCVNTTTVIYKYINSTTYINSSSGNCNAGGGVGYVVPGVAVLIEPRRLTSILNVTLNMMENLPKHWKIQIFTSANNTDFLRTLLKKYYDSKKVLIDDSILGSTTSITRQSYNDLLVKEELWNTFIAEKVLIFQVDSVICKDSQRDIASFLQYDYIGAPWQNFTWTQETKGVGNGGFSLRSKSKSLEVIKNFPLKHGLNEDGYFARGMTKLGANMPTYNEALQFSVERIFYSTPFGVHRRGYTRFTADQQKQLLEYCPEIALMG